MKIVINACFGGFGLSNKAKYAIALRKNGGREPAIYRMNVHDQLTRTTRDDLLAAKFGSWYVMLPKDEGGTVEYDTVKEKDLLKDVGSYNYRGRVDADLVAVVEDLGSDEASDSCARLKVVDVPDDVDWTISDYDGYERVEEVHRTWG